MLKAKIKKSTASESDMLEVMAMFHVTEIPDAVLEGSAQRQLHLPG